jgi:hypothetical protein
MDKEFGVSVFRESLLKTVQERGSKTFKRQKDSGVRHGHETKGH